MCIWPATVHIYVQEGRLWACTNAHPSVHRQEDQDTHVSMDGNAVCLTCVCACVWHKQETGLWPLLLPCGREALQNVPDRWRQPLTTDLPHLPRTRPSPAPAHVREPDWTSEF